MADLDPVEAAGGGRDRRGTTGDGRDLVAVAVAVEGRVRVGLVVGGQGRGKVAGPGLQTTISL